MPKVKKQPMWEVDKLGFVTNGKHYFHYSKISAVFMHEPLKVNVHIEHVNLSLGFPSEQETKKFLKWIKSVMQSYQAQIYKHHQEHHKPMEEMIKIMKKGCADEKRKNLPKRR